MKPNKQRCFRCSGRKKVYKVGNGYSLANFGGVEVNCPLCLGVGEIDTLETAAQEATKKIVDKKKKESEL